MTQRIRFVYTCSHTTYTCIYVYAKGTCTKYVYIYIYTYMVPRISIHVYIIYRFQSVRKMLLGFLLRYFSGGYKMLRMQCAAFFNVLIGIIDVIL